MLAFQNRVVFIGFGSVARCTLPILFDHVAVPPDRVTIVDFDPEEDVLAPWIAKGVQVVRDKITPDSLDRTLGKLLAAGDILIDLAWNIDTGVMIDWCHHRGVRYLNTAVELWDPYDVAPGTHPTELTLYARHMRLREIRDGWREPGPTAVVEHGANPGLISHFTKQALLDIAAACLDERKVTGERAERIQGHADARAFNHLAHELGVKVIHCSERDTQIGNRPKEIDEFVNTWSVEGFREEGTMTAELGWGTHEQELPEFAYEHTDGPGGQICLARMGINTQVASWVPGGPIVGMVVRHGEAFTITDHLTVWRNGRAIYRPTMHYAYCPCDAAIASLWELRGRDYEIQPAERIMYDEIICGDDILGAFLMGHPLGAWWCGSILSIEESRRLVPGQNATTMQVAVSAVAAVMWMIRNADCGLLVPDDLPHDEILDVAKPYLGDFVSTKSDWRPPARTAAARRGDDPDAIWQFRNFLLADGDDLKDVVAGKTAAPGPRRENAKLAGKTAGAKRRKRAAARS
ncbi:MAG: saccharopine dehydrogenase NADP-binding domain-containing protein [Pirellulales bacterium]|nr:saccharopine dehydrogenase NADP-binding domain-containing protein [Pirellulales bacterium]